MKLKLIILAALTTLTGIALIFIGVSVTGTAHHGPATHSAVYHRPHADPVRIT